MTKEEVKKHRKQLGMSQEKYAALFGVSFYTIHRWETGKMVPSQMAQKIFKQITEEHPSPCKQVDDGK